MKAFDSQVEADAALARTFQENEWKAGRAPKPPPLHPEYAPPPKPVDQSSHFGDWSNVLEQQAQTLQAKVQKAQETRQRQRDAELAQGLQAEELGAVGKPVVHAQAEPAEQRDRELAQNLQAQELEAAQNSNAPVDWSVLDKLQGKPEASMEHVPSAPHVPLDATDGPALTPISETSSLKAGPALEVSTKPKGLESLSNLSVTSTASSVGPGTPVASEVIPPDGFFDGIKTDPKIVPVCSPEEMEDTTSCSTGTPSEMGGSPLHDSAASLENPVGSRLRHMKSIPHVLRTNSFVPTWDEKSSTEDHELLVDRLKAYGLAERHVAGDGNCQFRALSDQLYQTPEKHEHVRRSVYKQLKHHSEFYDAYVSDEDFKHYIKRMATDGEWGDHITLQAAADRYGLKISLLTTFKDNGFIQIDPRGGETKSQRVLYLSFWADVHYNSVYPASELPPPEQPKHRNAFQKFVHNVFAE